MSVLESFQFNLRRFLHVTWVLVMIPAYLKAGPFVGSLDTGFWVLRHVLGSLIRLDLPDAPQSILGVSFAGGGVAGLFRVDPAVKHR